MVRSSKHILKFSNKCKLHQLNKLYKDYEYNLRLCISLMLKEELSIHVYMSSKLLAAILFIHSYWKQIVYKQASEIVRSEIKRQNNKRYNKYKKCYVYFKQKNRQQKFLSKRFSELKLKSILKCIKIDVKNVSVNLKQKIL